MTSKESSKKWREKNPDYSKEWYRKNKGKATQYHKKHREKCKQNDNLYIFKENIRALIYDSFKRTNHQKKSKAKNIIGISFDELYAYLKETWKSNYGTEYNNEPYHVDHIIPLSTAKTEQDVIKLCHYTNLQLLTPEDNLKKSNKIYMQ